MIEQIICFNLYFNIINIFCQLKRAFAKHREKGNEPYHGKMVELPG